MKKNNSLLKFFIIFSLFPSFLFAQEVPNNEVSQGYKLTIDKIDPSRFYQIALIQALNKTTAKTSILEMKIGDKIRFGQLSIIMLKCWQASLDQKPESKILLEVFENKTDELGAQIEKRIFYGWMFASSPSIAGLEHPIYDLTALGCKNK